MPTLRQLVKQIQTQEKMGNKEPGAYPIIFKNDWVKIQFVILLRWENFKVRIKQKCHR